MRKLLSLLFVLGCVNGGDNNGMPDSGADVTNDVTAEAEASLPTGATLALGWPFAWVPQSGQAQVPFTITRNGVPGTLTVHAAGLPTGVTATDASVPDGTSTGTLTLVASGSATLGATTQAMFQLLDQTQNEDQKTLTVGVSGAPGALDTTWAGSGAASLMLPYNAVGRAIAVYPSSAGANAGKIVVTGEVQVSYPTDARILIARYNADGSLDTTFGDLQGDGGTTRLGYTLFNPGTSYETAIDTWPVAVRIDSKGRIAVANNRSPDGASCNTELGRWTVDGVPDSTFTRWSGNPNGGYCGYSADLAVTSTDDLVVLAGYNYDSGERVDIAPFSGVDGSKQGTGFYIVLDTTATPSSMKTTIPYALRIDGSGKYVFVGQQCVGGWANAKPYYSSCAPYVARVLPNGQLDTGFGSSAGYTAFSFGTGLSQGFLGLTLDPATSDIVTVGQNGSATLAVLARLAGSSGLPATFGSMGALTRDLYTGATSEGLNSVMIDSQGRIVAAGNVGTTSQGYVARTRCSANGTLDSSYASSGTGVTIGTGEQAALGIDDRLYVVGVAGTTITVWRYWP